MLANKWVHLVRFALASCMFTPSSACSSKASETKQMTEAKNLIMSLVFGTSSGSQSEGSVSVN